MSRLRNISNFENEWSNALGNASVKPPERVWNRLEVALDNPGTSSGGKRGFLLIPLLAAATISLALAATAVWNSNLWIEAGTDEQLVFEQSQDNNPAQTETLAEEPQQQTGRNRESDFEGIVDAEQSDSDRGALDKSEIAGSSDGVQTELQDNSVVNSKGVTLAENVSQDSNLAPVVSLPIVNIEPDEEFDTTPQDELSPLYAAISVEYEQHDVRPVAALLASSKYYRSAWTGMNLGAGSYDPNASGEAFGGLALAQSDSEQSSAALSSTGVQSGENIGSSVSVGVGAGIDLSKRWLVQGGVTYLRNQNYGFSNAFDPTNGQLLRSQAGNQQFTTLGQAVEYRSEVSFISVPVQMGYYLINRRFSWIVSSGISSDIFLGDNVTGQGVTYNFSQSPGEASDYNPVNFNLLLGTEVGYIFQDKYRFSVSPTIRHGLTPTFRSETGLENRPIILNLGFRFSYIFK